MDTTPGEVIQEGFLVKHCPNAIGPKALDNPWKPRYFVLKGHHLLYWKKKVYAQQFPNSPHCLVDLEGSTVERVSLVYAKPPPFQYCLCLATGIVHKGSFLTYHLCVQEEEAFASWFANLRKAAGQPEIPITPSGGKVHTRSLSTGGGLGATQKQPLKNSSNSISSSPTTEASDHTLLGVPSSSGHLRSSSQGNAQLPGILTERHFLPIAKLDDSSDTTEASSLGTTPTTDSMNATPATTPRATITAAKEEQEDTESTEGRPSPPPRKLAQAAVGLMVRRDSSLKTIPTISATGEETPSEDAKKQEEKVITSEQSELDKKTGERETSDNKETTQAETPSTTPAPATVSTATTTTPTQSPRTTETPAQQPPQPQAKPVARANSKQEEILNEIAKARQRVLELEKNNKLTPPSTVLSRGLSKTAASTKASSSSSMTELFTNRFAVLVVLLLIFYWYFF